MEIYVARNRQQFGPFPLEEVQRQLADGRLTPGDLAWMEGASGWAPLASFPAVQSALSAQPGTVPPIPPRDLNSPPPIYGAVAPRPAAQTSGAAIASLVLGAGSYMMFPFLGHIAAIICGHIARSSIRRSAGKLTGDGLAIAGLVLGYLGLALILLVGIVIIGAFVAVQREHDANEAKALANAKQIVAACIRYSNEHDGDFPRKLEELVPGYLPDATIFTSPLEDGDSQAYFYSGGSRKDPPDKVLLLSKFHNPQGGRVIVHVDGSGQVGIPPPDPPRSLRR